ncbi:hypothetical protein J0H58_01140 [bacterium]|nr:hypothetical protein [bacterium]
MEVHYQGHGFAFEPSPGEAFAGRLVLDDRRREVLAALSAAEDEGWYLDASGERLPADELFARSPWSCPGPDGPVKLLCRFLDLHDGSVRFNTPALYGGELFRWLRAGGDAPDAEPHAAPGAGPG